MNSASAFSTEKREGVYRAIRERRDMRHFRPDPVTPETLRRTPDGLPERGAGKTPIWTPNAAGDGSGLGRLRHSEPVAGSAGGKPIAILCLGHVDAFYSRPMLEQENWIRALPMDEMLFENGWDKSIGSEPVCAQAHDLSKLLKKDFVPSSLREKARMRGSKISPLPGGAEVFQPPVRSMSGGGC